ncbi:MAG: class I tRNA ligase family protein, partial [Patescibacteria group bacterium]
MSTVGHYDNGSVETKWQNEWEEKKIFSPNLMRSRRPFFNLMMFPYPSAEGLHVGNMYAFTGADIYGRFMRMRGYDVFEPIGLDGFGIHSENYAIKVGEHPANLAKKTQERFYKQLHLTGNAYDWSKTLETYDPDYYRWTQWIFVRMFKAGLAYRAKAPVNWCPSCKTVLADEQVIAGKCERCGTEVKVKQLEQWFFRLATGLRPDETPYPDSLLANLDSIDWSEKIKIAQRNWIGRSEGMLLKFSIYNSKFRVEVFTTRPDTLNGATFLVLSPESEWVEKLTTKESREKVSIYIKSTHQLNSSSVKRSKDKSGVFTGSYAINPLTGKKIPIWVADYVVGGYGSGAIMGVPAHDERDMEFVKAHGLDIV